MEQPYEARVRTPPHRFLDSAVGLARNDTFFVPPLFGLRESFEWSLLAPIPVLVVASPPWGVRGLG